MQLSMAGYKRLGAFLYYGALLAAAYLDKKYAMDGRISAIGRGYAVFFMVLVMLVSTGERKLAEIKAELDGGPALNFADAAWRSLDKVFFWFSLGASAWFVYKAAWWDALVYLGLPAWRGWLRLEARRLRIKGGEEKPSVFWRMLLFFCAAAFLISLALSYFAGLGPVFPLFGDEFHVYPAGIILSLLGLIISLAGSGGKI